MDRLGLGGIPEEVGLMTRLETVSGPIRLKNSEQSTAVC